MGRSRAGRRTADRFGARRGLRRRLLWGDGRGRRRRRRRRWRRRRAAADGAQGMTSVQLAAPKRVTGRKTVTVTGKVLPARAGRAGHAHAHGEEDGHEQRRPAPPTARSSCASSSARPRACGPPRTASARGELTVTARSKVKIKVRNRADGSAIVTGTVDPEASRPSPVAAHERRSTPPPRPPRAATGDSRCVSSSPKPGRYQVVFIPTGGRAERSVPPTLESSDEAVPLPRSGRRCRRARPAGRRLGASGRVHEQAARVRGRRPVQRRLPHHRCRRQRPLHPGSPAHDVRGRPTTGTRWASPRARRRPRRRR